jgi:hypothetical protein
MPLRGARIGLLLVFALGLILLRPADIDRHLDLSLEQILAEQEARESEVQERLKRVVVADGIGRADAAAIAEAYFFKHVGCGGYKGIRDGGKIWIVDGAFGYAGKPVKGFHIDKKSGRVISPIGPSYENPLDILKS